MPKEMPKRLPHGGVQPEVWSALVDALEEFVEVTEIVFVIRYGNEFQRRAAMSRLETLGDTLGQEHLPLLSQVQVKEADCAERCRLLMREIRSRLQSEAVAV